ncbi:integrase [Pyrococcus kukulkanii]|uniref:Integrase n=1 Tax=Pyrococcus kukulkanii TaxID=1609559 RepID=A0ABV4T6S8_9EURY
MRLFHENLIPKEVRITLAGRAGFEPATTGLKALQRGVHLVWSHYKEQFWEWLLEKVEKQELTLKTAKSYYSQLERFFKRNRIYTKRELRVAYEATGKNKHLGNALRNFFNFLEDKEIITSAEALEWKRFIKLKRSNVREVFVTDEEIREAFEVIKKRFGYLGEVVFKVTFYTGLRLTHVVELLNNLDKFELIVVNDKVARFSISKVAKGTKPAFVAYMPRELAETLTPLDITYEMAKNRTRYKRVSVNTMRKWFYTFLAKHGIRDSIIDFIQGRGAIRIGTKVYLQKIVLADEAYSRIVDDLKRVLEG